MYQLKTYFSFKLKNIAVIKQRERETERERRKEREVAKAVGKVKCYQQESKHKEKLTSQPWGQGHK
jgi:hypothetical protein